MKKQTTIPLLLSGLLTLSLAAAPVRKKPPAPVPAPEPVVAAPLAAQPAAEPKLHMANPFYQPYAREFQVSILAAMQTTRARADAPAQTYIGMAWPASSADSKGATYAGSVRLRYGIFDRFAVGVGTDYYTFLTPTTERTGASFSTYPKTAQPEGFTGPEFSLYGRFAGTRPGQVYFDAALSFRPGFGSSETNKFGLGRLAFTGALAVGMNIRFLTFGLGGSVYVAPSTSVSSGGSGYTTTTSVQSTILANGLGIVQAEWQYWYLRGSFGYARFLDPNNMRDPVNKNAFLTLGAGAGVKFTESTLLDFNWSYTPEVKSEEFNTGYALSFKQTNTVGPNVYYGLGFSFKLGGAPENAAAPPANKKPPEPAAPEKPENPNLYRGWHLAALGTIGISSPNAFASKYIGHAVPRYQASPEGMVLLTYYWNNNGGVSLGTGYAVRKLLFQTSEVGANFPVRFFDLRAGYRLQLSVFMTEIGVLYAIPVGDTPVEMNGRAGQAPNHKIENSGTKGFAAIYAMIGLNFPMTERLFGLCLVKVDYGITSAVYGEMPGYYLSQSNKIDLVPFDVGGSLGLAYKL